MRALTFTRVGTLVFRQTHNHTDQSTTYTVRQLLSSLIRSKLEGNPIIKRFDPRKELIISFVESLAMFPDELAADIINDFSFKIASMCVDNCLSSPKEFWVLFHLLSTALEKTDVNSRAFGATVNFLIMVGRGMVNKDTFSPFALLCDFAMPKLIQLCKRTPSKCTALAAVIYSYSSNDPDDNIHVIRVIRDALEDLPLLIRMLSTLVGLEQHFTEKLLDLYFYYIVTGLQHTTPDVRAVSISILASLAVSPVLDTGFTHVLNLWDRLAKLVDDEWQVQAQLVITAASLLGRIKRGDDSSGGDAGNNSGSNTKYASIEGVLDKLLTVDANSLVVMAGISSLPRVFPHSKYQALFLQLLYEREDVRAQLSDRQQSGDVPEIYNLPALPSLPIMEGIASDVLTQELENLSPHHVQALVTALSGFVALQPHEASRWMELLDVIKAHVAAELCDPSMSGDIVRILLHFLTDASTATAAVKIMTTGDVPPLYAVLPHIFAPDGPEVCREMMMSFLTTLVQSQPVTKQAVESLVKAFRANEPALYNGSPLEDLARTYSF